MTDAISTGLLSDLSVQQKQSEKKKDSKELGQDVFLELMVTQMKNQNPLDPQENSEFVAQLAQFSSVEGLDKLNNTMNSFTESFQGTMDSFAGSFQSSQALQASSLVGRSVKVETDTSYLPQNGIIYGDIQLQDDTTDLKVGIYDDKDQLVTEVLMGPQTAGDINFSWTGLDQNGQQQPPGVYKFKVQAMVNGQATVVDTALSANVDSVSVGANGSISLNLAGVGTVPVSGVLEIL